MNNFSRLPALRSSHRTRVSAKNGAFPQLEIKSHWRSLRLRTDDEAFESYFASWPRSFGTRLPVLRNEPEVLVMYRKRESAKEYEEREMLRRAFDTST